MNGHGSDWYRRPELILGDIITRAARGEDRGVRHYYRAVVLAIDTDGALLQNKDGTAGIDVTERSGRIRHYDAIIGPENPRGSVKARIITDGMDRLLDDADTRVFWPLLPGDQLGNPISPGEHVYVIFEGVGMDHGMWISRVSGHDSANSFSGTDSYTAPSAPQTGMDSFVSNDPEYETTDEHAGLGPTQSSMSFFGGG